MLDGKEDSNYCVILQVHQVSLRRWLKKTHSFELVGLAVGALLQVFDELVLILEACDPAALHILLHPEDAPVQHGLHLCTMQVMRKTLNDFVGQSLVANADWAQQIAQAMA